MPVKQEGASETRSQNKPSALVTLDRRFVGGVSQAEYKAAVPISPQSLSLSSTSAASYAQAIGISGNISHFPRTGMCISLGKESIGFTGFSKGSANIWGFLL